MNTMLHLSPHLLFRSVLFLLLSVAGTSSVRAAAERASTPNVVIIYADDLGYRDIGCFGAKTRTPNLDRLASEGVRFTDFYVSQAVCSASRATLLTGCYANRIGILGALGPNSKEGISDHEQTLAQVFKKRGYATAIYGKWHLGHHPQFLPTRHGFDDYFGLPYSNDMWPYHPTAGRKFPPLPLIEGERVITTNPDQTQLTTWYTEHAVNFVKAHREQPFFLYLPHSMPHVPLHVSGKFRGKSEQGLYGDVIMEIDWSVGRILETLAELNLDDRTLIMFASDNGPWLSYGNHAGSAQGLREGKGTMFEGGCRVPCVMRWPNKIPAGHVCHEWAATIDILPTMARLIGAELSSERKIDGLDIWPLISGQPGAKTPHEVYYYYWGRELQAIRSGDWKLHFPHKYAHLEEVGADGKPGKYKNIEIELALFNLSSDVSETTNVADQHPEVVARLQALGDLARSDLGDSLRKIAGQNVRQPGRLNSP